MQPIPIGQVLLRLDPAADAAAITGQVSAVALDGRGNLWLGAAPLDGIRRLVPKAASGQSTWRGASAERPTWGDQSPLALAAMFDLPDPGEPMDLTGMARAGDLLWFVGSHASERLSPDPQLTDAQNLHRLTWAEPIHRRACLGHARIKGDRLPQPDELALLPVEDGGNALTRALAQDPHLAAYFAPGPIPMAEHGLSLAGLACGAGRLWIGLSAPVLGGFAVVLEVEPWVEGPGVLGLEPIGPNGRPYRKHLIQLDGRGVQALRWCGDSLLILAGPSASADPSAQPGIYQLRGALTLDADSLTLADDPRMGLIQALAAGSSPGQWPRAMELYDGLGQPGVMVVSGRPQSSIWGAPDGVVADVYALKGV
jgi:hypothetical protein